MALRKIVVQGEDCLNKVCRPVTDFNRRLHVLMDDLVKRQSQFIVATHSPILMAFPGAQIYQLDEEGISSVAYEETEHYRLTRQFLNNPKRMLGYLLGE